MPRCDGLILDGVKNTAPLVQNALNTRLIYQGETMERRPKKLLSVYIDPTVVTAIENLAERNRRTKSGQIEYMLVQELSRHDPIQTEPSRA